MPRTNIPPSLHTTFVESIHGAYGTLQLHKKWFSIAVLILYIAFVNPANTPTYFSKTAVKFSLFAIATVVFIVSGPLVGTVFAIAMVFPVIYSTLQVADDNAVW